MSRRTFLVVFILKTFTLGLINAKECVTPYNENATCLPISACDVISSVLFTLTPRAIEFVKDSQCGCDAGMVCCGTSNNKPYPQLINCVPAPQRARILPARASDLTICGLDSSTDRILGGDAVKSEEFPWVAALEYKNKFTKENAGIRCGGSIVTARHILTAAHCIWDVEFELTQVWLGVTNITSEETCSHSNGTIQCIKSVKKFNVSKIISHELYDSFNKFNDIGLLELEADIEISKYIRPICLPRSDSKPPGFGTHFTVVGWGSTENGKRSEVKRKVQVPLKDNQICEDYLGKRYRNITSKQLCVGGERGLDACEGDSGGPLMYDYVDANNQLQWYQEGIVSYGTGCGVQGRPGIYINVTSYTNWIWNKIQNVQNNLGEGEPCVAQNGTIGACLPLKTCHSVFTKILPTLSKYYGYRNELEKHQCGQILRVVNPLICCHNPKHTISPNIDTASVLPDKTTCGIVNEEPRIKDQMTNFPWIAGIEVSTGLTNSTEIKCIGTVINSRYVLTTIPCVFGKENDRYKP